MHRDHDDEITVLVVRVHDQQPSPGTEDEPERAPGGTQLGAHTRKALKRPQGAPNPRACVAWKAVSDDQPIEVFDGGWAERYAGQALQLIEVNRLACASFCESSLGSLIGARNAVEQRSDVPCLRVRFFDGCEEQRSRERSLLHMRALREPSEPGCMLRVERDVQAVGRTCHSTMVVHE